MSDTTLNQQVFSEEVSGTSVAPGSNISQTSNGIIVGVDSPVTVTSPQGSFTQTNVNPATGKTYTEEDLARVRQQEKDK